MGDFGKKCKTKLSRALDGTLLENISNLVLAAVVLLLVISLLVKPTVLVGLGLFCLFIWAILCC